MKHFIRNILIIVTLSFTIIIANQTMGLIEVKLPFVKNIFSIRINMLIFICFFAGYFLGIISSMIHFAKKNRLNKELLHQSELEKKALQQQISAYYAEKNAVVQIQ